MSKRNQNNRRVKSRRKLKKQKKFLKEIAKNLVDKENLILVNKQSDNQKKPENNTKSQSLVEHNGENNNNKMSKRNGKSRGRRSFRYFRAVALAKEQFDDNKGEAASTSHLIKRNGPPVKSVTFARNAQNPTFQKVIKSIKLKRLARNNLNRAQKKRGLQSGPFEKMKKVLPQTSSSKDGDIILINDSIINDENKQENNEKNDKILLNNMEQQDTNKDAEEVQKKTTENEDKDEECDDDCILMEEEILSITIDDEEPPVNESCYIVESKTEVATPQENETPGSETDAKDNNDKPPKSEDSSDGVPVFPFYEDKNPIPNNSESASSTNTLTENKTDFIVLDDSIVESTVASQRKIIVDDTSYIVLDDTSDDSSSEAPDYIPLPHIRKSPKKTRGVRLQADILTVKERRQLDAYSDNAYNPNPSEPSKAQKRMVIIDGSNVAFAHGLKQSFSVKGVSICLEYFEKLGHEVKAVMPMFRQNFNKSTDPKEVARLHHEGKIIFTPCKNIPGKLVASYDDRFIIQLACHMDAAIISNDSYRDLINENDAFKKIIENRVVGYTWCNDVFILPKDPYGRHGPTLREILNRY